MKWIALITKDILDMKILILTLESMVILIVIDA